MADGTRRAAFKVTGYRLLIGVLLLVGWELASLYLINPFWVSSPSRIAGFLVEFVSSGALLEHSQPTLFAAGLGYLLGAVLGVACGFVLGRHEEMARVIEPYLMGIQGIPKIALAPLFIIWFGIGILPKVVLVALIVFFLVFFSTYGGVRSVSLDLKNAIRLLGATDSEIMWRVTLPATLPWIFVGLKVSVPNAMIGVVVGEFIAASKGLGHLVQLQTAYFNTTDAIGIILVIMVIVVLCTEALGKLEAYVLRWRPVEARADAVAL